MTAINSETNAFLARARLLSLDVDGVMTDGGLYYADDGRQLRKFNVKDGFGIRRLMAVGVEVAIISAGTMNNIIDRAKTLGISHVWIGQKSKAETLRTLCRELDIDMADAGHMGDDINDLEAMKIAGCAFAVADAVPEVLSAADHTTHRRGGDGAVREVCDMIVKAKGGPKTEPKAPDDLE